MTKLETLERRKRRYFLINMYILGAFSTALVVVFITGLVVAQNFTCCGAPAKPEDDIFKSAAVGLGIALITGTLTAVVSLVTLPLWYLSHSAVKMEQNKHILPRDN